MIGARRPYGASLAVAVLVLVAGAPSPSRSQTAPAPVQTPYEPRAGQPGKDAVLSPIPISEPTKPY